MKEIEKGVKVPYAYAVPIQPLLWAVFILISLGELAFKVIVLVGSKQDDFTTEEQEFYEIQSKLAMFLPILLLPFAAVSCIAVKMPSKL